MNRLMISISQVARLVNMSLSSFFAEKQHILLKIAAEYGILKTKKTQEKNHDGNRKDVFGQNV